MWTAGWELAIYAPLVLQNLLPMPVHITLKTHDSANFERWGTTLHTLCHIHHDAECDVKSCQRRLGHRQRWQRLQSSSRIKSHCRSQNVREELCCQIIFNSLEKLFFAA